MLAWGSIHACLGLHPCLDETPTKARRVRMRVRAYLLFYYDKFALSLAYSYL